MANIEIASFEESGQYADFTIRELRLEDAANWLQLCLDLDRETAFMLYEPGERLETLTDRRARIEEIGLQPNSVVLIAEGNGICAGYVEATGSDLRRIAHSVYIVLGVAQSFAGKGIGTALLVELEKWARRQNIYRMELTVMVHNAAAVGLYRKAGFEIEGTRKKALQIDGEWIDEYAMAKLV